MKNILAHELFIPLALLVFGIAIPTGFLIFVPAYPLFNVDLCYWYAVFLTLSGAIAAVKLTFKRLININPQINLEMIFESEEELCSEQALLTAHARTAELIIIGVTFFSVTMGAEPENIASALLFTSLRIGGILFLLGGIVMIITHFKMKKL